jgi:hypothetical protein
VYVNHDRVDIYVPDDIRMRLIECLSNPLVGTVEISYIFQIINAIITYSNRHSLKNKEF